MEQSSLESPSINSINSLGGVPRLLIPILFTGATASDITLVSVSHMSTLRYQYSSGRGKIEAHFNWSMVIPETVAPDNGTTLKTIDPVPADSRQ